MQYISGRKGLSIIVKEKNSIVYIVVNKMKTKYASINSTCSIFTIEKQKKIFLAKRVQLFYLKKTHLLYLQ